MCPSLATAEPVHGKGGLDVRAVLFWAFVGIPLAWGVWKTLESTAKIF